MEAGSRIVIWCAGAAYYGGHELRQRMYGESNCQRTIGGEVKRVAALETHRCSRYDQEWVVVDPYPDG